MGHVYDLLLRCSRKPTKLHLTGWSLCTPVTFLFPGFIYGGVKEMVFTCKKNKKQKTKGGRSTPVRSNAFSFFGSGVQHPPLTYPNPLHTNTLLSLLNDDICSQVQHLLWSRQTGMGTDCSTAEHVALCPQRHDTEPSIWIPRPLEGHR